MARRFLPFHEAREYVRELELPNEKAWREYCTSGKKLEDIPSKPDFVYRGKGWIDWYDWLGTRKGFVSLPEVVKHDRRPELRTKKGHAKHLPFAQAREYVRRLGLPNQEAWREYCTSGKKPKGIPSTPDLVYGGKGWNGWPDFLGIRKIAKESKKITYVSYAEAKVHAREKQITTYSGWQKYCKSGERPDNIPSHPEIAYKGKGWIDWPNFLGTRNVAFYNRKYVPFAEAKAHAREKNFLSRAKWEQYCKSGDKPDNIPSRPDVVYEHKGWTNISDFLGTGNIATQQTGLTINKVTMRSD